MGMYSVVWRPGRLPFLSCVTYLSDLFDIYFSFVLLLLLELIAVCRFSLRSFSFHIPGGRFCFGCSSTRLSLAFPRRSFFPLSAKLPLRTLHSEELACIGSRANQVDITFLLFLGILSWDCIVHGMA